MEPPDRRGPEASMLGPILDTGRLRLEPPRPEHVAAFVRWFADPQVTRYLFRRYPPSPRQEAEWLERMAASEVGKGSGVTS